LPRPHPKQSTTPRLRPQRVREIEGLKATTTHKENERFPQGTTNKNNNYFGDSRNGKNNKRINLNQKELCSLLLCMCVCVFKRCGACITIIAQNSRQTWGGGVCKCECDRTRPIQREKERRQQQRAVIFLTPPPPPHTNLRIYQINGTHQHNTSLKS